MLQHITHIDAVMLKHNPRQIAKPRRVEDVAINDLSLGEASSLNEL
jgi:hypothetical protein